jgi:thymidylate kinase
MQFPLLFMTLAGVLFVQAREPLYVDKTCILKTDWRTEYDRAIDNARDILKRLEDDEDEDFEWVVKSAYRVGRSDKEKWDRVKGSTSLSSIHVTDRVQG